MSITLKISGNLSAEDVENILRVGVDLGKVKRTVKEVDGPFLRDGEQVWIVYTKDILL